MSQISSEPQRLGKSPPEHFDTAIVGDHHSNTTVSRSIAAAAHQLQVDDQLTEKGRHLLGKYYNGPTQWLAPGGPKFKGKQVLK